VVDIVPHQEATKMAVQFVQYGLRCLKIKIGLDPKEDIERVRVVREAVGPDINSALTATRDTIALQPKSLSGRGRV